MHFYVDLNGDSTKKYIVGENHDYYVVIIIIIINLIFFLILFCFFSLQSTDPKPWALGAKEFTLLTVLFWECELLPEE